MLKTKIKKAVKYFRYLKLIKIIAIYDLISLIRMKKYQGGKIKTRLGELHYVDAQTFLSGLKEIFIEEIYKISGFNSEKPIIVDCGANIGLSAIFFAKHYNADVYAFEADPSIFECLKSNIFNVCSNKEVVIENKAVWVNQRDVKFDIEGGYSGQIHQKRHELVKKSVTVPSIRLRDLILGLGHVDLLKIDIEGAENQVIFDCADVLNIVDFIFIEWHSISDEPQMLGEILNLLKDEGFRYHIKDAFTSKFPFVKVQEMCGMDLQLNIFAIRR